MLCLYVFEKPNETEPGKLTAVKRPTPPHPTSGGAACLRSPRAGLLGLQGLVCCGCEGAAGPAMRRPPMTSARTLASSVFYKRKFHLMKISTCFGSMWSSPNFYIQSLFVYLFIYFASTSSQILSPAGSIPLNSRPTLYVTQLQMTGRRRCCHPCSQSGVYLRLRNVDANTRPHVWQSESEGGRSVSVTLRGALCGAPSAGPWLWAFIQRHQQTPVR